MAEPRPNVLPKDIVFERNNYDGDILRLSRELRELRSEVRALREEVGRLRPSAGEPRDAGANLMSCVHCLGGRTWILAHPGNSAEAAPSSYTLFHVCDDNDDPTLRWHNQFRRKLVERWNAGGWLLCIEGNDMGEQ